MRDGASCIAPVLKNPPCSVDVNRLLAGVATLRSPEERRSALRALIALLFLSDPGLRADLAPARNGSHDDLLADEDGEILDELAGKIVALVTTIVTPVSCA